MEVRIDGPRNDLPERQPAPSGENGETEQERPLALVVEDHGPTRKLLVDWINNRYRVSE